MQKVGKYFDAGYPCVAIASCEESRVISEIKALAESRKVQLSSCSITQGVINLSSGDVKAAAGAGGFPPDQIINYLLTAQESGAEDWVIVLDFHPFLSPQSNPVILRKFKDTMIRLRLCARRVILCSHAFRFAPEIEHEIVLIDLPLPDKETLINKSLRNVVQSLREGAQEAGKKIVLPDSKEDRDALGDAAKGMTLLEAENAYALSWQECRAIKPSAVMQEKVACIRKSGILELYPTNTDLDDVGGYNVLREWLRSRKRAFGEDARKFGLPTPKGVLLLGCQGVGKSLAAKGIAGEWNLPLIRLDAGKLFGGVVGASEENTRKAIQLAEAVSPCVLWIDEIDKGLAVPTGSVVGGGEVTRHVVGTLCTWLAEKTSSVFVVATANAVNTMPPELLRKGRLDEIFFLDLPNISEREEIALIVQKKYSRSGLNAKDIASISEGFSGAELEQGFIEGLTDAFNAGREITLDDWAASINGTVPLSKTREVEIKELREWAHGRARWASKETKVSGLGDTRKVKA